MREAGENEQAENPAAVKTGIKPERAGTQKDATEDQADEEEVHALADIFDEKKAAPRFHEGRAEGGRAAPEMDGLVVDLYRDFEEVGEQEYRRREHPPGAPAESLRQFPLDETAKKRLFQGRRQQRRADGQQHPPPGLAGAQVRAGKSGQGEVEADDRLHRNRRDEETEEELLPRVAIPWPERCHRQTRAEQAERRDGGDKEGAVHRAVERDGPDHRQRVVEQRAENHRAQKQREKKDGQDVFPRQGHPISLRGNRQGVQFEKIILES